MSQNQQAHANANSIPNTASFNPNQSGSYGSNASAHVQSNGAETVNQKLNALIVKVDTFIEKNFQLMRGAQDLHGVNTDGQIHLTK